MRLTGNHAEDQALHPADSAELMARNETLTSHYAWVVRHVWEQKGDDTFEQILRGRGCSIAAASVTMMDITALKASQKSILWKYILSQLPA